MASTRESTSRLVTELTELIQVPVFSATGEESGTVEIDPADFGGKISQQLLHEAVLMFLANQRAGTHSTLRRGEVAGSTRKLFRQKGTGNARVGTRRTNKRRGGGTAKGPKPRDYSYSLPKRAVRAATRQAILSKFHDQEALIIDEWKLEEIRTKPVADLLKTLNLAGQTVLIGTAELDSTLYKSARNIEGVMVSPVREFNTYIVLRQKRLLLTRDALDVLKQMKAQRRPELAGAEA